MKQESICELYGVTKWFPPDHLLFDHLDLKIGRMEHVLISGHAGSGKTTLIKMLSGELLPDEGYIKLYGTLAIVPDHIGLIPSMNLQEHIALPMICKGYSRRDSMVCAETILEQLGESRINSLRPHQMNTYERAVVAIGQAAIQQADIVIADAFMDNLSDVNRDKTLQMLFNITDKACIIMTDRSFKSEKFDRYIKL